PDRPYLGFCCWRLVPALHAQTSQPAADRVTATPETACDLLGALSQGPEFFEQRYVFRIPTHGRYYNADRQLQASLVFVRLAHNRWVLFVLLVIFIFFIFIFIRISGRHR